MEITPFCHMHTLRTIAALPSVAGCEAVLRMRSSSTNKPDGDENYYPLHWASYHRDHADCAQILVAAGADLDVRSYPRAR